MTPDFAEKTIPMREINSTPHTQVRAMLDQPAIDDYAEAMRGGVEFPPIVVFFDGFSEYWIADGWHRYRAARDNGALEIAALVAEGTERDAIWYAVTKANRTHGLRRSNADKRRTVEIMLRDPEWSQYSDRKIARDCGVDHKTVATVREELAPVEDQLGNFPSSDSKPPQEPEKRVGQDGKSRKAPEPRAKQAARETSGSKTDGTRRKKNGAEKVSPADRKEAKALWGQFVRLLKKTGWLEEVASEVEAISALVNKQGGR